MRRGKMRSGDVVLCDVQFTDTFEVKTRPAVVLFEDFGNIVVAGITSNTKMKGVTLTTKDGAVKDSVIKTNYIFTISEAMVKKRLFTLTKEKKAELHKEIAKKLNALMA